MDTRRRGSDGFKTCTRCRETKPVADFDVRSGRTWGYQSKCKPCLREYQYEVKRRTVASDPEAWRALVRKRNLWTNYRITPEQYDEMLAAQGGVCAICKKPPGERALSVDHDHACCPGRNSCGACVRKLLCPRCNTTVGMALEDRDILRAAVAYLDSF